VDKVLTKPTPIEQKKLNRLKAVQELRPNEQEAYVQRFLNQETNTHVNSQYLQPLASPMRE